jgi:ABC-type bacteriocin/lantibiotic exporter with double-glycine peptidase domain
VTASLLLLLLPFSVFAQIQTGAIDQLCGPRCAHFILRHFGRTTELYEIVDEMLAHEGSQDTSLADLRTVLEKRGLYVASYQLAPSEPLRVFPAICHFRETVAGPGHFVVVRDFRNDHVLIWDGMRSQRWLEARDFAARFSGMAIFIVTEPFAPDTVFAGAFTSATYMPWLAAAGGLVVFVLILWQHPWRALPGSIPAKGENVLPKSMERNEL